MTRRLHTTGLAGLLTALFLSTGIALASPGNPGANDFGEPPRDRLAQLVEQLELDADQTAALEVMKVELKTSRKDARDGLETIREALEKELAMDEPNSRAVHKLIDQKLALRGDLTHDRMDAFLTFRATLTAEQRAEFDALTAKRQSYRPKAHGRRGPDAQEGELWEER